MNHQAFDILEFPALRALVRRYAQTESARALMAQLEPLADFAELTNDLARLAEMVELHTRGSRISFDGVVDTADSIARLRIEGATLEPTAMLDIARLCAAALHARALILEEREAAPRLFEILAPLPTHLEKLAATITKKILPSGELDDRASPQLASIRRDLTNARSRITRSLENLMRRASEAIQEELVTVRNDRFVIPVKSDHQSRIKGVAHGSSSSGATVFIEPLETIEANNELQNLREAELREIFEILFRLSEQLRGELPAIELAAAAVTQIDFINAKAAFADRFDCVVPAVWSAPAERSGDGALDEFRGQAIEGGSKAVSPLRSAGALQTDTLEFIDARHPLLQHSLHASGAAVVPVSLRLDRDHPVMVISGANAGGKTVVLKTAGLLSLMALSGLPVPAQSARVPFYQSVLADIGDHQSLAANLSTFTSHVANIARMIDACTESAGAQSACHSLVLLDEVGTGTDPEEGSALGVAVVDHFKRAGAHVMATTHYSGLKIYAANESDVLNASVEFDEQTLRPTYRLLMGFAGSSSGLEIARRFGIPDELIEDAAAQVQQSSREAIAYLRRIKSEAETAEAQRKALEDERAATAEKYAALDLQFQKQERERRAEFETALKRSVSEFEKLTRELLSKIEDRAARAKVEREAEKRGTELKREAQRAAQAMSQAARSQTPQLKSQGQEGVLPAQLRGVRVVRDGKVVNDARAEPIANQSKPVVAADGEDALAFSPQARDFEVGDRVKLSTFGSTGIIDRIKGDQAEVRVGSLHMREKLSNLELITAQPGRTGNPTGKEGSLESLRRRAAATELHLHSKETDSKTRNVGELNLIGKKTDEATDLIDKFLDEAFLNGQRQLRIIHGHGTGALRRAVADLLADHPHVARFAPAPQDQGGAGATIVELQA